MGYVFITGYILLIGIATFLMKVKLKVLTPYQLNFLMGIGMLVTGLPALWLAQRSFKIPTRELPVGILIGLAMAGGSLLYTLALNKLSASVASVLAGTYVVVVILLSWLFLKESFDLIKFAGLALTFAGVLLLTYRS